MPPNENPPATVDPVKIALCHCSSQSLCGGKASTKDEKRILELRTAEVKVIIYTRAEKRFDTRAGGSAIERRLLKRRTFPGRAADPEAARCAAVRSGADVFARESETANNKPKPKAINPQETKQCFIRDLFIVPFSRVSH